MLFVYPVKGCIIKVFDTKSTEPIELKLMKYNIGSLYLSCFAFQIMLLFTTVGCYAVLKNHQTTFRIHNALRIVTKSLQTL